MNALVLRFPARALALTLMLAGPLLCTAPHAEEFAAPLPPQQQPNIVFENDSAPLNGTLKGTLQNLEAYSDYSLRLLWVDGLGRVITHVELNANRKKDSLPFALKLSTELSPAGRNHRLVLLRTENTKNSKKNKAKNDDEAWAHPQQLAEISFRLAAPEDIARPALPAYLEMDTPLSLATLQTNTNWADSASLWIEPLLTVGQPLAAKAPYQEIGPYLLDEPLLNTARQTLSAVHSHTAWTTPPGVWLRQNFQPAPLAFLLRELSAQIHANPAAAAQWTAWLKQRYGRLFMLNAEWNERFTEWEQAQPPPAALGENGNYAPAFDALEFRMLLFARLLEEYRQAAPRLRLGLGGTLEPAPGALDWATLGSALEFFEIHDSNLRQSLVPELCLAFNPRARLIWNPPCTSTGPLNAERDYFEAWLRGVRGFNSTYTNSLRAGFPELLRGLSEQCAVLEPAPEPVALYYSPASLVTAALRDSSAAANEYAHNFAAWLALLRDLGRTPRILTQTELLAGWGDKKSACPRVIILPETLCLNQKEAEALRSFVNNGGDVWADHGCGLYGAFGKRREGAGNLDGFFNMARDNAQRGKARVRLGFNKNDPLVGLDDGDLFTAEIGLLHPERTLGTSEQGPALSCRRFSSKSVEYNPGLWRYLNLDVSSYLERRQEPALAFTPPAREAEAYAERHGTPRGFEALRLLLAAFLEQAKCTPLDSSLALQTVNHTPVRQAQQVLFRSGESDFGVAQVHLSNLPAFYQPKKEEPAAIAPDQAKPDQAKLEAQPTEQTPEPGDHTPTHGIILSRMDSAHWFDALNGKYLGFGKEATLLLRGTPTSQRPELVSPQIRENQETRQLVYAALSYRPIMLHAKVRRLNGLGSYRIEYRLEREETTNGDAPKGATKRLTEEKSSRLKTRAETEKSRNTEADHWAPHQLWLEFYDPEGRPIPRLNHAVALTQGETTLNVELALNDAPGGYKIIARDLLTGLRNTSMLVKEEHWYADLFPLKQP